MAVTFVTNERSYELNLEYRDTDRPTDVISLEYKPEVDISFDEEDLAENPELAEMLEDFDSYIGELFISIDKAKEQAEEYGHSYEREMGFLAVHGFCILTVMIIIHPKKKKRCSAYRKKF
ncbi:Endoribonuclease YbeY [Streptococcus agalactiae]|nr:Endoribonuclease YbeY [Streptococcus agalactiae]